MIAFWNDFFTHWFPFPFPRTDWPVWSFPFIGQQELFTGKKPQLFFFVPASLEVLKQSQLGQGRTMIGWKEEEEQAAFGKRLWGRVLGGWSVYEMLARKEGGGGGHCSWRLTEFLHRITKKSENDEIWSEMRRLTNDWWDRTCVVLATHLSELSIHFEWSIAFSTRNWTTQLRSTRSSPIALCTIFYKLILFAFFPFLEMYISIDINFLYLGMRM